MPYPTTITLAWLLQPAEGVHDIPPHHVEICRREWPDGAPLTRVNLARAAELGLSSLWLAARLLAPADFERFREEVRRATRGAWDAHDRRADCLGRVWSGKEKAIQAEMLADALGLD